MAAKGPGKEGPVTIKKYANRRLYNTATSSYVTLEHLADMVKRGEDFVVYDAKSGDDITRSVLTQIIFEEESKGQNLLPIQFLRQLIRFYGDSLQAFVPGYLEMSMEAFSKNQERFRNQISEVWGVNQQLKPFEEMARQNFALLEKALKNWPPFAMMQGGQENEPARGGEAVQTEPKGAGAEREMRELREQIARMQDQLNRLTGNGDKT